MPGLPADAVWAAHFSHFFASSTSWPLVVCIHTPAAMCATGKLIRFFQVVLKQRKIVPRGLQVMFNTCTSAEFLMLGIFWVAALWGAIPPVHDSQGLTLSAMLKMHRWLRVPLPQSSEQRRGRKKNQKAHFFSAYETNVWHSTEHCSAVGLSVNRRQYARARWRPIQLSLPRKFKSKEEPCTSPLLLLLGLGCANVFSLSLAFICN